MLSIVKGEPKVVLFEDITGDPDDLLKRFMFIFKADPKSKVKTASEIGITLPTLHFFLTMRKKAARTTLLKILNYVERVEKELKEQGKMP